jgi:APA family basic amino acid/polyamine antiporter
MWRRKSIDAILEGAQRRALHRTLGPVELMLLGIGSVIGTGIFVLTSDAAQLAGPGMIVSFVIAALVCAATALCYAEIASMVPVSGSAYTYSYAVLGEVFAWLVGWALILEYAVSASAVAVGWSGYFSGLVEHAFGWKLPAMLTSSPAAGGLIDLPAVFISLLCTVLLVRGTKESARVNAVLVALKICALALFFALAVPAFHAGNFQPFAPKGPTGVINAASSIFFAYIGFDAVSTASEETRNPQRNVPIGLIGSLVVCTIIYILVAGAAVGALGAQPVHGPLGEIVSPGSRAMGAACATAGQAGPIPLVCSNEALAYALRQIGHPAVAGVVGVVAFIALPTVILMMIYGQTRLFFVMARDGLLPGVLTKIHGRYKTPHVVTWITGLIIALGAAFFPVGALADVSNSGTLFAFFLVAVAVLILRRTEPGRARGFRTPAVWIMAPLAMLGCVVLFVFLSPAAKLVFPIWSAIGVVFYLAYGIRHSRARPGADAEALLPGT